MSIPLFGLAMIFTAEKIFKKKFFSPHDWRRMWVFGVVASLVLYPSALGLTRIDTYSWGWAPQGLLVTIVAITLFFLWEKNRFGIVLVLALFAFAGSLKTSTNFWDYLVDPLYGIISIIMFTVLLYRSIKRS